MNRRDTLLALLALSTTPFAANTEQPRKVWRIGALWEGDPQIVQDDDPLIKGMRELGYMKGRDYVLEFRDAGYDLARLPALAAELVTLKMDLILPLGTPSAIAARNATRKIPIVLMGAGDPVGSGLAASLGRPGGNITGITSQSDIDPKRLDLLRQLVPGMLRIGYLHDPKNAADVLARARLESACKEIGLRLIGAPVSSPDEIIKAFVHLKREKAQGTMVSSAAIILRSHQSIIESTANQRLPAIYAQSELVDRGGLISYGANSDDRQRRVAVYIDKIFKGAKPGDLPIEQPTTLELVINRKTVKALGLTIPQSLLIMADRVVE